MIKIFGRFSQWFVTILIFSAYAFMAVGDDGWNLLVDEDGVALYTRATADDATSEIKGVCVVERPLETVGRVLSDVASYPKWFFRCHQSRKIPAQDSTDLNFLLYIAIDTPWPFVDRDVVYKVVTTIDDAAGKVIVHSTAVKTQTLARRNDYVRITNSKLQWIFEKLSAGQTRITFINHTHAAGLWGDYISYSGARATTLYSLKNLKKLLDSGSFTQRHQHYRARRFFKDGHSDIVDSSETHFFRELVASQNNQICAHIPCHFTGHQRRVSGQTLK
jgi:hypothetical protein